MTHDAIAALAALHARLQARLALMPEFRALKSIEASLRDIEQLAESSVAAPPPVVDMRSSAQVEPQETHEATSDVEATPRHDANPLARALARGIEHNVAHMKAHRGVGF